MCLYSPKVLLLWLTITFCHFLVAENVYKQSCADIQPGCWPGFDEIWLGECGWGSIQHYCVKHSNVSGTWEEMKEYCSKEGAVLLDIPDASFFDHLMHRIREIEEPGDGYWIGGSDSEQEGRFRWLTGKSVTRGTPFWGKDTDDVQDPDGGTLENCIFMPASDHHYFADRDCTETHRALCRQINEPFRKIEQNLCVQFVSHFKGTWQDARELCTVTTKAEMLELNDANLMHKIVKIINDRNIQPQGDGFWIAGKQDRSGEFVWGNSNTRVSKGTPFWGRDTDDVQDPDGGPEGNCILMSKKDFYYFADRKCDDSQNEMHGVLCSLNP